MELKLDNVKLQNENKKFQHDEASIIFKAENEAVSGKNKILEERVKVLEKQNKVLEKQNKILLEEMSIAFASKNEEAKRKAASVKEYQILEGVKKYIAKEKTISNQFDSYMDWFSCIEYYQGENKFRNYILFVDDNDYKSINFTEKALPIFKRDEHVFPYIGEGWSRSNTKCFHLKEKTVSKTSHQHSLKRFATTNLESFFIGNPFTIVWFCYIISCTSVRPGK